LCVSAVFEQPLVPVSGSFLLRENTMDSVSFDEVRSIEERSSKVWQPGWGTIVILLAILQLLLSVMLDR
jgi:hypothetical protein